MLALLSAVPHPICCLRVPRGVWTCLPVTPEPGNPTVTFKVEFTPFCIMCASSISPAFLSPDLPFTFKHLQPPPLPPTPEAVGRMGTESMRHLCQGPHMTVPALLGNMQYCFRLAVAIPQRLHL